MKIAFWVSGMAQVAWLYWREPAGAQIVVGAVLCAAVVALLWQMRELLPVHTDMGLIMVAFGGLGMLLGSYGEPVCHQSWGGNAGMLLGAGPLSIGFARCLQRPNWIAMFVADMAGMGLGMFLMGLWIPMGNAWVHHAGMLAGMLAGMYGAAALIPFSGLGEGVR